MKSLGYVLLWLCSAAALGLAYPKIMQRQWLSAGLLLIIGISVIVMSILALRSLNRLEEPVEPNRFAASSAIQDRPITMRQTEESVNQKLLYGFGFVVIAICIVMFPDNDWKQWLFYAGVFVLLGLTGLMMMLARDDKLDRIIADANGIVIRNKVLDAVPIDLEDKPDLPPEEREEREEMRHAEKVEWREVRAVKMVSVYHRKVEPRGSGTHKEFEGRELVLYGHNGKALMRLKDPLAPPEAYQRFLGSIPRWTGLTIQEASETK